MRRCARARRRTLSPTRGARMFRALQTPRPTQASSSQDPRCWGFSLSSAALPLAATVPPEVPELPGPEPEAPDPPALLLELPVELLEPELPDVPGEPDPELPDVPGEFEAPELPDVPELPLPLEPEPPTLVLEMPVELLEPELPEVPGEPEPELPDVPGDPEGPELPEEPELPLPLEELPCGAPPGQSMRHSARACGEHSGPATNARTVAAAMAVYFKGNSFCDRGWGQNATGGRQR